MGVNLGRFLAERCSTPIWWRSARFSNSRAARERKIEDKVAKRVAKEISIGGENYDSSIIPVRSDISRFSRGTVNLPTLGSRRSGVLGFQLPRANRFHQSGLIAVGLVGVGGRKTHKGGIERIAFPDISANHG